LVDSSHFVLTFEKPQSPGLSLNCFFISKFCSNTHGSQVLRQNQACSRDGLVGGVGQGWNFFVQICSLPKYPSFLEGDLTHVAFGYGGYIRLTVRPQHQVGRLFFFSGIPNRFQQHRHDTHSQLLLIIARKLNVVSTCWILLSIYVSRNLKYCTIPLKCVQIDNPVKIFGFVKQLCGILKKPVEKINSYEIQWLHYFAIIINKISNFTAQQASSNLN